MYVSGPSDRKFVAFYAVVLTLIRYFVNEILLEGLASVGGVKPEKRGRFKDQGWQCMYYLAAFVTGLNLLADTEWGQALFAGDTKPLFQDYPVGHIELTASFKYYYLLQVPFMPPPRPLSAFCFVRRYPAWLCKSEGAGGVSRVQLCFWVHQLFVLYIEEWRKDMPLYLFHHIITIGLIASSYCFNFTRVGTAILVE